MPLQTARPAASRPVLPGMLAALFAVALGVGVPAAPIPQAAQPVVMSESSGGDDFASPGSPTALGSTPAHAAPAPAPPSAPPRPSPAPARSRPALEPAAPTRVWDRLADCESGLRRAGRVVAGSARWDLQSGNGYFGGLQFSLESWRWVGGSGRPHEHPREEQIRRGRMLQQRIGWSRGWPRCARRLGLG